MHVINHTSLPRSSPSEGCECRLVAGATVGDAPVEVHLLQLAPGAATPSCCHDAALVVLVLDGCGKQRVEGAPQSFAAPCTLCVPAGAAHEIVNNGVTPLQLVVITGPATACGSAS